MMKTGKSAAGIAFYYAFLALTMYHHLRWCIFRDIELAKFEAFLNREQCKEITALVRGRQQLAYPIKG